MQHIIPKGSTPLRLYLSVAVARHKHILYLVVGCIPVLLEGRIALVVVHIDLHVGQVEGHTVAVDTDYILAEEDLVDNLHIPLVEVLVVAHWDKGAVVVDKEADSSSYNTVNTNILEFRI